MKMSKDSCNNEDCDVGYDILPNYSWVKEVNKMEFKLSTTVVIECSSFVFLKTLIVLVIWLFNQMI